VRKLVLSGDYIMGPVASSTVSILFIELHQDYKGLMRSGHAIWLGKLLIHRCVSQVKCTMLPIVITYPSPINAALTCPNF